MNKLLSLLFLLAFATLLSAQNFVVNGDFEDGATGWRLSPGAEVLRGAGVNGNTGLKFTRTSDMKYDFITQRVPLEPGQAYRLSAMVKAENVTPEACTIAVEYMDADNKWIGGNYNPGLKGTTEDWVLLETNVTVPMNAARSTVTLYMDKRSSGTVYYDTVKLEPMQAKASLQMVYPVQGHALTTEAVFRFNMGILGFPKLQEELRQKGKVRLSLDGKVVGTSGFNAKCQAEFRLEQVAPGAHAIRAELLDAQGASMTPPVVAESTVEFLDERKDVPQGACYIDEYGRAIVDGKPFLPIGLYMAGIHEEGDLDKIQDSDFNTLMPYGSYSLTPDGKKRPNMEGIQLALDELQRRNLKIIYSVKDLYRMPRFTGTMKAIKNEYGTDDPDEVVTRLVTAFRNHPAILAWYNNDEVPLSDIEVVIQRRQLLNRLDPNHPVWGVLCDFTEAPFFGATCDVLGVDPYPIRKDKVSHQESTLKAMNAVEASGQPCWAVPQIFNWGVYQCKGKAEEFPEWVQPSPDQMRGIMLLEALRGARGFIAYSFFDIKRPYQDPARFGGDIGVTKEDCLRHWEEAKELATMLKGLSPWLLTKKGPEPLGLNCFSGKAQAAIFHREDTKAPMILVASIGPDNVDTTLMLPPDFPPMKATYGHATETAPGVWNFSGNDVWGEVLMPQ